MERKTNAEALDILYAVALGEGFIAGMYDYKKCWSPARPSLFLSLDKACIEF